MYRTLATLREDVPRAAALGHLEWRGARRAELVTLCAELGDDDLVGRIGRWRD